MVEPDLIGSNDPLQLEMTALLNLEMKEALSKRMILSLMICRSLISVDQVRTTVTTIAVIERTTAATTKPAATLPLRISAR